MLRRILLALLMLVGLAACGGDTALYVPNLLQAADQQNGKDIAVNGAFIERDGQQVLALGFSNLDNGLDAQPLGDPIWLEGFPENVKGDLHRPGDAIYGFVRVNGRFETGQFGPENQYKYRIVVASAEAIERVRRTEVRMANTPPPAGQVSFFELADNPTQFNGQTVTTQGYYFWNSVIYVLAEGVSTEEDGSNPQPIGRVIWMEGFPPDVSGDLNVGPNTSFVWGKVEVQVQVQAGGNFGKDGAYNAQLTVQSGGAKALEPKR